MPGIPHRKAPLESTLAGGVGDIVAGRFKWSPQQPDLLEAVEGGEQGSISGVISGGSAVAVVPLPDRGRDVGVRGLPVAEHLRVGESHR